MVRRTSHTDLMRWANRRTAIGVLSDGTNLVAPVQHPLRRWRPTALDPFETIDPIDFPLPLKPDFFALPNARRLTA